MNKLTPMTNVPNRNPPTAVDVERLRFRRQFLWGRQVMKGPFWVVQEFGPDTFLSTHSDLEVEVRRKDGRTLAVVGSCIHPLEPHLKGGEIADRLISNAESFEDLLRETVPLSGRWVVLFLCPEGWYSFTDPIGFRRLFYSSKGNCGSDPNILRSAHGLEPHDDPELQRHLTSKRYQKLESPLLGSTTLFKDCKHLLPNHYLDLQTLKAQRFFPSAQPTPQSYSKVLDDAAEILEGTIEALLERSEVAMPITAGWDSRVLLAASRRFQERIPYFVNVYSEGGETHPDAVVSTAMANHLGLQFRVNHLAEVQIPEWFSELIANNVSRARILPKSKAIYHRFGKTLTNINGNGSEICRHLYRSPNDFPVFSAATLSKIFTDKAGAKYATRVLGDWLSSIEPQLGYNLTDLLLWEQRLGNWGAHFPAEQDIAIEEVSPFNNRALILSMLSLPRAKRAGPKYPHYRDLIRAMWPELLEFPFNPLSGLPAKARVKGFIERSFPRFANKLKR